MKTKKSFHHTAVKNKLLLLFLLTGACIGCLISGCSSSRHTVISKTVPDDVITLPIGGNSWNTGNHRGGRISNEGITRWRSADAVFTTYIRLGQPGNLNIWLDAEVPSGKSELQVTIDGESRPVKLDGNSLQNPVYAGTWKIKDTGYVAIRLSGISKEGAVFANVKNLLLSGTATEGAIAYTKDNEGNFFYWGRRGPSVHLNYAIPKNEQAEWFYNEVTVPVGNDVLGSYFMADGFSGGYFGMQVNSPTERHILFSVWSPYHTNNPKDIPDSMQIHLLKKGTNVTAKEFGNEGSGGQSFMNYPWKAGTTYKFLLHGVPDGSEHTVYTAYFYTPEDKQWHLIASFRRPKTHSYLKGLYSFLENFSPDQGDKERRVLFGNQWIRTSSGKWIELNRIKFTTDNTGRKGYRMDYAGGVEDGEFYLQNCGFFNHYTPPDTWFERSKTGRQPDIDFSKLP